MRGALLLALEIAAPQRVKIPVHGRRVPVHLKLDHISVLNFRTQIADAEYMLVLQSRLACVRQSTTQFMSQFSP